MIDVLDVDATLRFDVDRRVASATAAMRFVVEADGPIAFDLRQDIGEASLDGKSLPVEALVHRDLGGGPGAEMRVIDRPLDSGSAHELTLNYELITPQAEQAMPVGWEGGALFDLWMSDLYAGRYLEMWIPAHLCHDRFALTVNIQVDGDYVFVTNGEVDGATVRYPEHFTSLSPMLLIVPSDELTSVRRGGLSVHALAVSDLDLEDQADLIQMWLQGNRETYGEYVHGDNFTAYVWDSTRGMEYDGATTAAVGALEHEVFHSWFGRGVKPASQNDGWIDEAYTTWSTASGRYEGERFAVVELDLDQDPVLLSPQHPWCRATPTDSYREGAKLFAGIAHLAGGADQLKQVMRAFYQQHTRELVTTQQLEARLASALGARVNQLFARYVYGRGD